MTRHPLVLQFPFGPSDHLRAWSTLRPAAPGGGDSSALSVETGPAQEKGTEVLESRTTPAAARSRRNLPTPQWCILS